MRSEKRHGVAGRRNQYRRSYQYNCMLINVIMKIMKNNIKRRGSSAGPSAGAPRLSKAEKSAKAAQSIAGADLTA